MSCVTNLFISSVQFTSIFPAALCSDLVDIDNGMVMFNTTSIGDTATYSCDSGFELIGAATTTCTEMDPNTPEFLPQPPVCRREYCMDVIGVATTSSFYTCFVHVYALLYCRICMPYFQLHRVQCWKNRHMTRWNYCWHQSDN